MSESKSMLASALCLKCPRCHEVSMFENPKIYTYHKIGNVKSTCENCGANLKPESGFYFGAAYVSYGLTIGLWITILIFLKIFAAFGWINFGFLTHPETFLATGIIVTLVVFPYLFRLSRSIWAHLFIKSQSKHRTAMKE